MVGTSPPGAFSRAAALNDAAAGTWDVGVVLDADVIADPAQIRAAIQAAATTGRMTLAFTEYRGLGPAITQRILAGFTGAWDRGVRYRSMVHESSIVAVPRALWDEVGGFDERFVGWGQEDVAFAQACRVLGGELQRIPGVVWHLWHPRSPHRNNRDATYRAAQALGARYRRTHDAREMRALLAERGHAVTQREQTFIDIYDRNEWNGTEATAGPGSTRIAVARLREWLPKVMAELGATSILDAGCGDAGWMPNLPGYVGVDVVQTAVERSKRKHPRRIYARMDICTDVLPPSDVIFCRDAMQHMSYADGYAALENFRRTGRWLIASSHSKHRNRDVPTGHWYPINLECPPFSLGPPIMQLDDGMWDGGVHWPDKIIGVWALGS